jgi:hypothetical protein
MAGTNAARTGGTAVAEKAVHIKGGPVEPSGPPCPIGRPFVYQSSIWKIEGMYLATTRSGQREVWWILTERMNGGTNGAGR